MFRIHNPENKSCECGRKRVLPKKNYKKKGKKIMKKMKKLVSLMLAVVMVLAMTVMASAATYSKEEQGNADLSSHTFKAYQIFSAESITEDGTLGNIDWGTDLKEGASTALLGSTYSDINALAEAIGKYSNYSDEAQEFAKTVYAQIDTEDTTKGTNVVNGTTTLPLGYYLIVDTTDVTSKDDVNNLLLLQVSDAKEKVEILVKTDKPSSEKKVIDVNDSDEEQVDNGELQDSADYDIGDKVPFQLKGTVAANFADYEVYKFTFHDKEATGLTFDAGSVVVKVGDTTLTKDADYTIVTGCTDGCTFEIKFDDLKKVSGVGAGSVITVDYKSELNENAVIGSLGNKNEMYLTYSNNPNDDQGGENGKTPTDTVIVFTYKVVVNKVDENGNDLSGAEFTLYKYDPNNTEAETEGNYKDYVALSTVEETPDTTFTFKGLDDGEYVLVETKTPDGYNTISDQYFTVSAEHGEENGTLVLKNLSGDKETGSVITLTSNVTEGSLTSNVENKKGTTLPETGGIGTTIFYVVGIILVLGAGLLLITKKRMSAQK